MKKEIELSIPTNAEDANEEENVTHNPLQLNVPRSFFEIMCFPVDYYRLQLHAMGCSNDHMYQTATAIGSKPRACYDLSKTLVLCLPFYST